MDKATIQAYDETAEQTARLHASLCPSELHELMQNHFIPQGKTADIGCGMGRDCDWLKRQGHDVTGYDASSAMLAEARKRYPQIPFVQESLPLLATIPDNRFDNVLCSAVIMHLLQSEMKQALDNLLRILRKGGIVLLSFRGTRNADQRENGKLYVSLSPDDVISTLTSKHAILCDMSRNREVGRDLNWQTLIFKK